MVTDPLHVTWYGTFVTTPTISATSATVDIKTEIRNDNAVSKSCMVKTDIVDAKGTTVTTVSTTQTVAANTTVTFDQTTPAVANPSLWHPDDPNLYSAVTTVSDGTTNVDNYATTFGFRWISWSATSGFSINGSHYYFHGADVHQDHAGWGDGVTNAGFMRDVKMVKDAGFNFIRGSHYPKDPAFADACDQLGVLFWSENCFWGYGGATGEGSWNTAGSYPNNAGDEAAFETSVKNTLTDMIRIHRNHPSIVAWSMSNEPFFTASATMTNMSALLAAEVALVHRSIRRGQRGSAGRNDHSAAAASTRSATWPATTATAQRNWRSRIPASRCRHRIRQRGGDTSGNLRSGLGKSEYHPDQRLPHEYAWRSGQALWCAFDHGSIGGTKLETMASWTTSVCPSAPGTGIAMPTPTCRHQPGLRPVQPRVFNLPRTRQLSRRWTAPTTRR